MRLVSAAALLALLAGCDAPVEKDADLVEQARSAGVAWEPSDWPNEREASEWLQEKAAAWKEREAVPFPKPGSPEAALADEWLEVDPGQARPSFAPAESSGFRENQLLGDIGRWSAALARTDPPALAERRIARIRALAVEWADEAPLLSMRLDSSALAAAANNPGLLDRQALLRSGPPARLRRYLREVFYKRIQLVRNAERIGGLEAIASEARISGRAPFSLRGWVERQARGPRSSVQYIHSSKAPDRTEGWPESAKVRSALRRMLKAYAAVLTAGDERLFAKWKAEEAQLDGDWSDSAAVVFDRRWAADWSRNVENWTRSRSALAARELEDRSQGGPGAE